jgi:DNA repair protein RecN (Recombination protein N)
MLVHLHIENYAIADRIDVEFDRGMTVITGETGAGKSILLDALGLALGDRADATAVRHGCERADIHATFDLGRAGKESGHPTLEAARQWLAERDLLAGDECLLRRVITAEGRSRGYINGQPVPLQDLKAIGEFLLDLHSQHAHQSLLKKHYQRALLDAFAGSVALAEQCAALARRHADRQARLTTLIEQRADSDARLQLLRYQIEELTQLALGEDELELLEAEQKRLANGEQLLRNSQQALALCREGEINATTILYRALRALEELDGKQPVLAEAEQLLGSALIQVEEASRELQQYVDSFELDPGRLIEVEQRLSAIYDIARKHRVPARELPALLGELQAELDAVSGSDHDIEALQAELAQLAADYRRSAGELSSKRKQAAQKLQKQVEKQLQALAMGGCRFSVALNPRSGDDTLHPHGLEEIELLVSTNPGTPPQPLGRIASGGELSRISLAIQVVAAQTTATPTLIFDEVDVGIGGATAEVVGNLLRELGARSQVICVTHQPQVASKGHHHFSVTKSAGKGSGTKQGVRVELQKLQGEEKIEELARMLGGIQITEQSRAHAREMLSPLH